MMQHIQSNLLQLLGLGCQRVLHLGQLAAGAAGSHLQLHHMCLTMHQPAQHDAIEGQNLAILCHLGCRHCSAVHLPVLLPFA